MMKNYFQVSFHSKVIVTWADRDVVSLTLSVVQSGEYTELYKPPTPPPPPLDSVSVMHIFVSSVYITVPLTQCKTILKF